MYIVSLILGFLRKRYFVILPMFIVIISIAWETYIIFVNIWEWGFITGFVGNIIVTILEVYVFLMYFLRNRK